MLGKPCTRLHGNRMVQIPKNKEPIFYYKVRWCGCEKDHVTESGGTFSCDKGSNFCGVVEIAPTEFFNPHAPHKGWKQVYPDSEFCVCHTLGTDLFPEDLDHEIYCSCYDCGAGLCMKRKK
eukprot:GHVP01038792.1.p2 GENE.GHVP01038792.1~~GHVP01038792.1.p2  ORF type:complete len:121 (-),score=8.11 GHVP01038792.1:87-449(-)